MAPCVVCRTCYDGHSSHKKDSAWAWIVCAAAASNLAFTTGLMFSFGVLLPVYMDYFNENRERTAWIGSLSLAIAQGCAPLAGSLVHRFGCRIIAITGCLTCALSLTTASFAENLIIMYVSYSVFGVGGVCVFLAGVDIVQKCFDKWKSIALGIISAGQGLGTMVLSQVLQFLVNALSWRNALRIIAGALAVNSFFGLLYDPKIDTTSASTSEPLSSEEVEDRRTPKRFTFNFSIWKVPGFLVLTITYIVIMFGRSVVYVHLVKYCEDRGASSDAASRLVLFMGIQTVLGRFACGFLCSYKRLENWYINQGVLLMNGVSTMLLTLAKSYGAFVAYAIVFGFTDGAWATVNNIQAITCVDNSRAASAFGFMLLAGSVTTMIGPPLSGFAADKYGSYEPAFYMAGGTFLVGSLIPCVLCCLKIRRETGEENTEHVQELQVQNDLDDVRIHGPLKAPQTTNDRKRTTLDNLLFISTV